MKTFCTLLLSLLCLTSFGKNATLSKLATINKCWNDQKDIDHITYPTYANRTDKEWIRLHLSLVEKQLRQRNTTTLTTTQKQNRTALLDQLHTYWQAGNFPINEHYKQRTPIFIDEYNNFCAVGYLVKVSGNENVARMIAANTNLAYVHDMKYPELKAWANQNGFTIDELAWIQPTYFYNMHTDNIGKGVDGEVTDMFNDTIDNRLFVGGSFTNADSSVVCNNIAYVTGTLYSFTWHNLGTGVNGQVNSIVRFDNKIFAGGSFTMAGSTAVNNIAYWDGTAWNAAGCITGTVNNLVVFNNELYAAGDFDVCSGTPDANFAKWNGSSWTEINGLNGLVNTMQVADTSIVLGGMFSYGATNTNAIKWSAIAGFSSFTNDLYNEVRDFEIFRDTLYAVCKAADTTHKATLFVKLAGNTWAPVFESATYSNFTALGSSLSFNTICGEATKLSFGGQFAYDPHDMFRYSPLTSNFNITPPNFNNTGYTFELDSAINKMVVFNGELFLAGKFKKGYNGWAAHTTSISLNGIAQRHVSSMSVKPLTTQTRFSVYPNPIDDGSSLTIENNFNATNFVLQDINGRQQATGALNTAKQTALLPHLAAGNYILELSNNKEDKAVQKIIVR